MLTDTPAPQPDPAEQKLLDTYGVTSAEIDAVLANHPHWSRRQAAERAWARKLRLGRKPRRSSQSEYALEYLTHRNCTQHARRAA